MSGVLLLATTGVVTIVRAAPVQVPQRQATTAAEQGGTSSLSIAGSFDGQPAALTVTLAPTGSGAAAQPLVSTVDSVSGTTGSGAGTTGGSDPVVLAAAQGPATQAPAAQPGTGTAQSLSGRFFAPWGGGAGVAWNDQDTSISGAIGFGRGGSFAWSGDQPATSSSLGADLRLGQSFSMFNQKIFSWGVQGTADTTETFKLKGSVAASIPGTKFGFQGSATLSWDPQNGWQLKFAPLTDRFSLGSEASASITGTLALPGWTPKRLFSEVPGLTGTAQAAQPPSPGAPANQDATPPPNPGTTAPDTTTPDTTTPGTTVPDTTTPSTPDTSTPDTPEAPAAPEAPAVPDVSSTQPAIPDVSTPDVSTPDVSAPVVPVVADTTTTVPAITDPTPASPVYTPTVPDIPPPADISSDLGNGLGSTGSDLGNGLDGNGLDSGSGTGVTSDLGNGLGSSDTGGLGDLGSTDSGGSLSGGDGGE